KRTHVLQNTNSEYDAAKVEEVDAIVTSDEYLFNATEDEYEVFDLKIIHRKNRTGFEENKDLPIVINSVIGGRYVVEEYLGSAAFSKVVQARDLQTGVDVCLKIIKNEKDFFDQS
nr:dual specificity tyrosine-phosphorylation-regulated kinase 4-like [Tanacetum cinerariifolium]